MSKIFKLNLLLFFSIMKQKFKAIKCSFKSYIFKKKNLVDMIGTGNLLIIQHPVKILPFTILISVAFKIMIISFFIPS